MADDSPEVVQQYVETWALNPDDENQYFQMVVVAERGDVEGLEALAREFLNTAPEGTGTWHTRQNLSDSELDIVDWVEVADTLRA